MVAILNPDVLPDVRMSVDEYLQAVLPEGFRYELVEGVVEVSPVPGVPHDAVIGRLNRLFVLYAESRPDLVGHLTQRSAVTLVQRRIAREPDFAVYAPAEFKNPGELNWQDITPVLVVEVTSPGQERRDYEIKPAEYLEAGVPEYWIADPDRRLLTVMLRDDGDWTAAQYGPGQSYRPASFPGLEIAVASLFS